ncbi:D-glycero-beta-D-manno-heptose 1-phosphate adenylyltransferase [Streptomyces fulvorobeus]|uniref:D-glycero-beta-D-manno-heptose 1-phosphate adenylyltransferase n=1 Tax=Streptomyces fulvorobeus TaxID=284028 RepID=A0A7J0CG76_9ACTN|nr:D-glycero-beta-D-manno-heptose 1-phosphate adenylyltransferase [Streptomyces fulvorobeus]NYE44379.1 rfaE bifunctional protein nucleotidyltransferase chain/domain [Streptomyces fulvorobeus]GFN00904.1 bifunctional protein HldE [Streptomyces fulvorobeus]
MKPPTPLLVVGDTLLDRDISGHAERLAPDAPVPVVGHPERRTRPGGAALAACLGAADGREITLVTALGDDEASHEVRALLKDRVRLVEIPLDGTLACKTRLMADGRPMLRLDDGDGRAVHTTAEAEDAVAGAHGVLVADYGRGTADVLRDALTRKAAHTPVVWDPHPAGGPPVPGTRLATPAASEARHFAGPAAPGPAGHPDGRDRARNALRTAASDARRLLGAWDVTSVVVTLGEDGALLCQGGTPLLVPAPWRASGDCCGAGDRFAVTVAGRLADGELPEVAVREAVEAAARFVADGGAHTVLHRGAPDEPATPDDPDTTDREPAGGAYALVRRVRENRGTVVAAGGCFDLLHAGHVELLQAARKVGDCLVVCVNSDASVRRRKGDGRPVVTAVDRVKVLEALDCVDAVVVFDEDTPERLLAELRPDVWAKGGDYALSDLPEATLLESWGGQVVLLPYLDGRSSTRLVERASRAPGKEPRPAPSPRR